MTPAQPLERLEALRRDGADARNPVQFRYLESLASRLDARGLHHSVHWHRLVQAVSDFEATCHAEDSVPTPVATTPPDAQSPLAELLATLNTRQASEPTGTALSLEQRVFGAVSQQDAASDGNAPQLRPLRALAKARAEVGNRHLHQRLNHAITQIPADAGPMNAHRLVSRALAEMQRLSPDYTLRFARYMDTLMALERLGRK
ncbi:MAG: DUF2894 domain-containing protein [Pseudomonadota bacterium]|nr:DUF2894 domain-containing protein [Pseudomonadota bacterium]